MHHTLCVAGAAVGSRSVHCHNQGEGSLHCLHTGLDAAADGGFAVGDGDDLLCICRLGHAEFLSYLRTYLGGIAVDGLATAEHYVNLTHFLDGLCQGVGCGEGVGTAECTVGKYDSCICTAEHCFADHFCGAGQTHGKHRHGASGVSVFKTEGLFQSVQIFRIKDGGQSCAVDSAIFLHSIFSYVAGVGHLLGKNYDV